MMGSALLRLVRRSLAVALALLTVPAAAAGSPSDPEVRDGTDNGTDPDLDLRAAWLEPAPNGVLFTIEVAGSDAPRPGAYYGISFAHAGKRLVGVVAFDGAGASHSDVRPPNFEEQGVSRPSALRGLLRDIDFDGGSRARISAVIPYSAVPGLGPGTILIDLIACTGTWEEGRGWNDEDCEGTSRTYRVEATSIPVFVRRNMTLLLVATLIGVTALGAGAGLLVWRWRRGRA